jgi:DNA polymerase-3 subunit beta
MVGMARANFPQVPVFPSAGIVKLPASSLRTMIAKTIFAISNEESRYTLNGALLVLKPESMTMVATDGHRLAHIQTEKPIPGFTGELRTLIPKKAMSELNVLLQENPEAVEFARDESTLFFRIGDRLLTSRQLTGQFPNYEAVLPRDNSKVITIRSGEVAGAIQRVAQFADERSGAIKVRLEKNEMKISSSSSETGESEDSIEVSYTGDALTIGFNSHYLLEFLKASDADEVLLELKDGQSAGQMRPASNGDYKYRYVVMPMRI